MALHSKYLSDLQEALRANNAKWEVGENQFTDIPIEDWQQSLGYTPGPEDPEHHEKIALSIQRYEEHVQDLTVAPPSYPNAFSWRNVNGNNFVSPVKNQGSCGSCVAFATAATVETAARVNLNLPANASNGFLFSDLSAAQLFYCFAEAKDNRTCKTGWWYSAALGYCKSDGVVPDYELPYTARDQNCNVSPEALKKNTQISAFQSISSHSAMKTWLATNGPLAANFVVYPDFLSYKSGVYHHFLPWVNVPNSGDVIGVTIMQDGTILGIGTNQQLYTRATLTSNWINVPNSGDVLGVACPVFNT
jgi:C1A family cysteine protease